ncbi:MAG: flagellar biosynthetic protein FliO [Lachnospirales bacterium]
MGVLLATKVQSSGSSLMFGQLLFLLFILFIITVLIYALGYVAKKNNIGNNGNIKIIERRALSTNSCLFIIEINNNYYLLSQSKERVELITKLENFELQEAENNFSSIFDNILKSKKKM